MNKQTEALKMIQIKSRYDDSFLFECEAESIKECVESAVSNDDNLSGADLRYADLRGADLRYADLRGAYLRGADLRGASLIGADLSDADLSGANLSDAYLRGADLRGADLSDADLSGAYLRGAYLRGADLRGAYLRGEILTKAPISILNLTWDILITDNYMRIGCQRHTHDEWANFNDLQIHNMESRAIEFWTSNRDWLLAACKAHKGLET